MILFHRVAALALAAAGLALVDARSIPGTRDKGEQPRAAREAGCPVRGVWQLMSMSQDGKDQPLAGLKQWKVVTDRYWMWIGQEARRDTLPLKTAMDTLRVYRVDGGAGTYTTSGTTYIEQIELFVDPSWIGMAFKATCRIEGDRWYHSWTWPNDTTAAPGPYQHTVEVWHRVE